MTAKGHVLYPPLVGSLVRSATPASPRPLNAHRMDFAALETAPRWARKYTRWFLSGCRDITTDTAETAELVVSELVTNAYQAAGGLRSADLAYSQRAAVPFITVSLRRYRSGLLIEVIDSSREPPSLVNASMDAENGRGLLLVDALSTEWGYSSVRGGKSVYCILPLTD